MSSCQNRKRQAEDLAKLNQSTTDQQRLNSSVKAGTNENLHLSSALSEIKFNKKQTGGKFLESNHRNSISHESNGFNGRSSPKTKSKRRDQSARKNRQPPHLNQIIDKVEQQQRILSGIPKNRMKRHTQPSSNSLSIGP